MYCPDINDPEAKLTHYGYNKRALCNALSAPMSEVNSFLHGHVLKNSRGRFKNLGFYKMDYYGIYLAKFDEIKRHFIPTDFVY